MNHQQLSYESLKAVLHYLNFKKRRELVKICPSLSKVDKLVPTHIDNVELAFDHGTCVFRCWIDGLVIKVDNLHQRNLHVKIDGQVIEVDDDLQNVTMRCVHHYLDRPGLTINKLTINKTFWPSSTFFPERVDSLKLVVIGRMVDTLHPFRERRIRKVIVVNSTSLTGIFGFNLVSRADRLLIITNGMQPHILYSLYMKPTTFLNMSIGTENDFSRIVSRYRHLTDSQYVGCTFVLHVKNMTLGENLWRRGLYSPMRGPKAVRMVYDGQKCGMFETGENELVVTRKVHGTIVDRGCEFTGRVVPKGTCQKPVSLRELFGRVRRMTF